MPGVDFESYEHLRGTMLTEAGWEALQGFVTEPSPYVVTDEAFTPECVVALGHIGSGQLPVRYFSERPDATSTSGLVNLLSQVSLEGTSSKTTPYVAWHPKAPSKTLHIDIDEGNSVLGYFNVKPYDYAPPMLHIYDKPAATPEVWKNLREDPVELLISQEDPTTIELADRQMILLSGAALQVIEKGVKRPATLPHAATQGIGARRARLMFYCTRFID